MATLTTQHVSLTGLEATYAAAAGGGDEFTPDKNTFVHVKNGGGSDITATVVTPNNHSTGLAIADVAVTVTAAEDRFIGPFPYQHFAGSNGLADITYSGTTSVTVAVLRVA